MDDLLFGADPLSGATGDAGSVQGRRRVVGRVLGTEDATPLRFWIAVDPESYVQLDDVVAASRLLPTGGSVMVAGVVTAVRSRHEGAQFASDVFLIEDGVLPGEVQESAEVTTTRVDPERYVPPRPGAAVHLASGELRDRALCFDRMEHKVVAGLGRDGQPIYVNLDFIDGTRGAHVSISGVSGVATKTSFALFLLYSLIHGGGLGERRLNAKALVFSVKGEDLLFLDKANSKLGDDDRDCYRQLGLPAEPFTSVSFYAPAYPGDTTGKPNVASRSQGVQAFWWTLDEFCRQSLLPFVFADAEDERHQYSMVVHEVTARLRQDAHKAGDDGAVNIDGKVARTYEELTDLIVENVTNPATRTQWAGPTVGLGTVNAFVRRLRSSIRALQPLVRADLQATTQRRISTQNQRVTVVDLHNLTDRAQRFVVGVVLAEETERKEQAGPGGLLFTMVDELNKYAPRDGTSPIKELLLDIAERGRSLGIILIGAQQTASEVSRRIIANSAIRVVGRLDSAEAARPEYAFLPASQRGRAVLARPGSMFLSQPEVPVPLAVEFPFPAWATRPNESMSAAGAGEGTDPFAKLATTSDDI